MAISRPQINRQLRKDGGILTIDDARRMAPPGEDLAYINKDEAALLKSLGGAGEDINGTGIKSYFLKKVFRKAKKAVKKVVKSPVGKAAILGALTFGIPGTQFGGLAGGKGLGSFFGKGSFNPLKSIIEKKGFGALTRPSGFAKLLGKAGLTEGAKLTGLGKIAGITGLSGLAGLAAAGATEDEEDEIDLSKLDRGEGLDIADIVKRAKLQDSEFRFLPGAEFTDAYAAEGGRIGKQEGGEIDKSKMIKDMLDRGADDDLIKTMTGASQEEVDSVKNNQAKGKSEGGRINLANGGNGKFPINPFQDLVNYYLEMGASQSEAESLATNDYEKGISAPKKKAEGGLMNLGGMEMDLRGGGFVPLGAKEKADDVPARLSKNEFVMTADAVRAAGGGSVDKGADKMYNLMKDLESRV